MCLADKHLMFNNSLYVDFKAATFFLDRHTGCVIIHVSSSYTFHVLDPIQTKRCIDQLHYITCTPRVPFLSSLIQSWGPQGGGGGSGDMCYVQNSLACYVLCKFLFTLLCAM